MKRTTVLVFLIVVLLIAVMGAASASACPVPEDPTPTPTQEPVPTPTKPACVNKQTFYWTDGWCRIRQSGGPGNQSAPNAWAQNLYCGCEYAHDTGWEGVIHDTGWEGVIVNSCEDQETFYFWEAKPLGCGALECQ